MKVLVVLLTFVGLRVVSTASSIAHVLPGCPLGTILNRVTNECENVSPVFNGPVPATHADAFATQTSSHTSKKVEDQVIVVPANTGCPTGFVLFSGSCVKSRSEVVTAPSIKRCPPHYTMDPHNEKCVIVDGNGIKFPATVTDIRSLCSPGYHFDGRECFKSEASCPPGYTFNPRDNICQFENGQVNVLDTVIRGGVYPPPQPYPMTHPCPMTQPCHMNQPCPIVNQPCSTPCVNPPCVNPPCVNPPCITKPGGGGHDGIWATKDVNHIRDIISVPPTYTKITEHLSKPYTELSCPKGFILREKDCVLETIGYLTMDVISECPPGYHTDAAGVCIKFITDTVSEPSIYTCPPGFMMVLGKCEYKMKTETKDTGNGTTVAGTSTTTGGTTVGGFTGGATGMDVRLHTTNTIHVPVNINNVNNQTVTIHTASVTGGGGGSKHDTNVGQNTTVTVQDNKKCCEVVSPRICRRRSNKNWGCFHRRTQQCGNCCTAPQIYIRPHQPIYKTRVVVMPPPPPVMVPIFYPQPMSHDCSMCYSGNCPHYCNSYDCEATNSCQYVDQDSYCSEYGGRACSQDFGCMGQDFCS